ncbi:hypothetical protein [Deinococcus yavapaiensis]|uniref:hypothetical protein n=1 Tax=Deinococcus yavapaiensis TaxID=309889 RepID=UPI001FE84D9A|nr:hypothetical protein [Deinococcus yavapaiensis]
MLSFLLIALTTLPWRTLDGRWTKPPLAQVSVCDALRVPSSWDVRSRAYADVTGDGRAECVLIVWRPWRDWRTSRWTTRPSPIGAYRDARGDSAHVAVLTPLAHGRYVERWVGSAMAQPALAAVVFGAERLAVLEGSYRAGRTGTGAAVSVWKWTGFGFRLETRVKVRAARALGVRHGHVLLR